MGHSVHAVDILDAGSKAAAGLKALQAAVSSSKDFQAVEEQEVS